MSEPDFDLSTHPHDAFAKAVFTDPARAAALFRNHLPPSISTAIDWSTLLHRPGSFVKKSLQQAHSDLLFTAATNDGRDLLVYLLFEHQTSVDPRMPLRLLEYVVQILLEYEAQHGLPLPPVIPFVLHQGPATWTISTHFEDLFDLPEAIAPALLPFLPKFQHLLLDLTTFDPARQESHGQMRVVLQLMKLAREGRLMSFFEWLKSEAVAVALLDSQGLFSLCLLYAYHNDQELDLETIASTLSAKTPSLGAEAMTLAQKLINQGKAEGKAEGRQEGTWAGKVRLLEELLGLPMTPEAELLNCTLDVLQRKFAELQGVYHSRFKNP